MKLLQAVFLSAILTSNTFADTPSNVSIGNGIELQRGYYLLLKKSGENWLVQNISQEPLTISDRSSEEVLVFNPSLSAVEPDFSEYGSWIRDRKSGSMQSELSKGNYICRTRDEKPNYNPCDSNLTQEQDGFTTMNLIGNIVTLGMGGAGRMSLVSVGNEKIRKVLKVSGAIEAAQLFKYQTDFKNSTSSNELKNFIGKYRNNDPGGLVAQAEMKIPEAELAEKAQVLVKYRAEFEKASKKYEYEQFVNKYRNDDPDKLVPKAEGELRSILAKEDAEIAQSKRDKVIQQQELFRWQDSLSIGDETNCGPVIELKRGLVKVSFPVANYGNEHWIKKTLIRRPGDGCRFLNGAYVGSYSG